MLAAFCDAGLWPGLGRRLAGALADGGVRRAEDITPAALRALPGVGLVRADRLAAAFAEAAPVLELVGLLVPAGLPARPAPRLAALLGDGAATTLRADPWRLLEVEDTAFTVAAADRLAASLGVDDPARRDPAVLCWLLARAARSGHTVRSTGQLAEQGRAFGMADPPAALAAALERRRVVVVGDLVALERYARAERALAAGLAALSRAARPLGPASAVKAVAADLDSQQRAAVRQVLTAGVSVITGGPGTGKSRTVSAVVRLVAARRREVALAAPTGRAAKRLEELTGHPATTLHRLLGAQGTSGQFQRGADWPLDEDVIVVDETSMLDTELAAALLAACRPGTHLLLVGDPAQLPSIGAGQVLADVVGSGLVPVTELRTLYRQAEGGAIARLATAVRGGVLPPVEDPDREVVIVPARGSPEAARRTVQLVTDSIPRALAIPAGQVQVVTPVHAGPAGTLALNAALKAVLNPGPGAHRGYDPGDRVVATANHLDAGFANGEVGTVLGPAGRGGLRVAFPPTEVEVPPDAVIDLRLGWAVTVHRAQGSEWPAVVVVLPPEATRMLTRPLIYTALTRAQRHLSVVHAAGPAVAAAVAAGMARPRRTRLGPILAEQFGAAAP